MQCSGYPTFKVSYSAVTSPGRVSGVTGPSMNDINQGYLGRDPVGFTGRVAHVVIQSMITSDGNNTYGIRFLFVDGSAEYVTVVPLPRADDFTNATDIWASLVEKAYAQYPGQRHHHR